MLPGWQTTSVVWGGEGGGRGVMVELKASLRGGGVGGILTAHPHPAVLRLLLGKAGQEPTIRPLEGGA